jgi:hypothetical protein
LVNADFVAKLRSKRFAGLAIEISVPPALPGAILTGH